MNRQSVGPFKSPKQTGFVAYVRKELGPILTVLRGFSSLLNSWRLFDQIKSEMAVHSVPLIFWSAFKRLRDSDDVRSARMDFTVLDKLAPFLCRDKSSTPSQELQENIHLEGPISAFLYVQAQKMGMAFLASTVSL